MRQVSNSLRPEESTIPCTVRVPSTLRKTRSSSRVKRILLEALAALLASPAASAETATSIVDGSTAVRNTMSIDGHNAAEVARALAWAQKSDKPALIACKTIIGFGLPTRQGTQKAHSDAPGAEEIAGARKLLGWDFPPFVIPDDIEEFVVSAITRTARTGKFGDGKIFVTSLNDVIRIRTGERGEAAL